MADLEQIELDNLKFDDFDETIIKYTESQEFETDEIKKVGFAKRVQAIVLNYP